MRIYHSIEESRIHGIKIGRSEKVDTLDLALLKKEIQTGAYDQVRVKVNTNDTDVFLKLDSLGIYYQVYTVLQHLRFELNDYVEQVPATGSIERYTAEHTDVLKQLIKQSHHYPTALNYTSLFTPNVSEFNESEAAFIYIHNCCIKYPELYRTYLLREEDTGEWVGYHFYKLERTAFGILMGTVQTKRNKGYAQKLHAFAFSLAKQLGCRTFESDVSFQNQASMRACLKMGFKPVNTFFHIVLHPYLSLSNIIETKNEPLQQNQDDFLTQSINHSSVDLPRDFSLFKTSQVYFEHHLPKTAVLKKQSRVTHTLKTESILIETYLINSRDLTLGAIYLFYKTLRGAKLSLQEQKPTV